MEILSFSNVLLGFGVTLIAIARVLDGNLTTEWRQRISLVLRSGHLRDEMARAPAASNWQSVTNTMLAFSKALFHIDSPRSFIKTSAALSLTIIILSFCYLFARGDDTVQSQILSLFSSNRTIVFSIAIPLLATLIIDMIAAFQTVVFLRMIGACQSAWQAIVLIYSNLIVSIGLFSLLFPLVIILLLSVENQLSHEGLIILRPIPTVQKDNSKRFSSSIVFGHIPKDYKLISQMIMWNVNASVTDEEGSGVSYGVNVLSNRDFSPAHLLPLIHHGLKTVAGSHIKVLSEKITPASLYLPTSDIKVRVRNLFDGIPLTAFYRVAFDRTNLFGANSLDVARGDLLPIQASSLAGRLSIELILDRKTLIRGDTFLLCDDNYKHLRLDNKTDASAEASLVAELEKCNSWAAIGAGQLKALASLALSSTSASILVTPFALSSLTVTIVVYIMVAAFFYAFAIRRLLPKFFSLDLINVENIPLTVTASIVFVFLLLPLALLLAIVSRF